jgi:release factor glutamine methyltransferase
LAGFPSPAEDAGALLGAAAGDPAVLEDLVGRRLGGEPLAWLTGETTFCGLNVRVGPGVYVPRPQTEALARRAASLLPAGGVAVDLCTGCGAIAVVLADAVTTARVVATDLDPVAVACARGNGVEVFEGSLDEPLPTELSGRVDVLTSVVPYVPTDALRLLPRDVRAFEPPLALDGGADGTEVLREVASRSVRWLKPGGWLLLELGGDQAAKLRPLLQELGFDAIEVFVDDEGDPRAIVARSSRPPSTAR